MAEDRFASEVAGKTAALVVQALRNEGLVLSRNGVVSKGATVEARILPKLVVRVDEAAGMLARTPRAVRRLIDKGELKAVRHGRSVRIAVTDIQAFIAGDRS